MNPWKFLDNQINTPWSITNTNNTNLLHNTTTNLPHTTNTNNNSQHHNVKQDNTPLNLNEQQHPSVQHMTYPDPNQRTLYNSSNNHYPNYHDKEEEQ
jgi:hypothetical protein